MTIDTNSEAFRAAAKKFYDLTGLEHLDFCLAAAIEAYLAHTRARALSEIAQADAPLLDGDPQ